MIRFVAESPAVRNLWLQWEQLEVHDKILYKRWKSPDDAETSLKLIVPETLRETVLKSVHDDIYSAHLGVNKTYSKLHRKFFWYQMKESVHDWIKKCSTCGARKSPATKPRAKLGDCRHIRSLP